jgi:DNA-binding IclR family transcriptional regulator
VLLRSLVERGYLHSDGSGRRLRLGVKAFETGSAFLRQVSLLDAAREALDELVRELNETCHLAVLDGTDVVYLDKVYGRNPVRMPSRTGGRAPAACTAVGKALLAFSPPERQEQVLRHGLPAVTPHSVTDPVAFRAELADIARRGVAFDREEVQPGLVCAGVPIQVRPGSAAAAISISGPAGRLDLDRVTTGLQATGMAISRALQREVRRFCWREDCFPFESAEQMVAGSPATSEYRVKVS